MVYKCTTCGSDYVYSKLLDVMKCPNCADEKITELIIQTPALRNKILNIIQNNKRNYSTECKSWPKPAYPKNGNKWQKDDGSMWVFRFGSWVKI